MQKAGNASRGEYPSAPSRRVESAARAASRERCLQPPREGRFRAPRAAGVARDVRPVRAAMPPTLQRPSHSVSPRSRGAPEGDHGVAGMSRRARAVAGRLAVRRRGERERGRDVGLTLGLHRLLVEALLRRLETRFEQDSTASAAREMSSAASSSGANGESTKSATSRGSPPPAGRLRHGVEGSQGCSAGPRSSEGHCGRRGHPRGEPEADRDRGRPRRG